MYAGALLSMFLRTKMECHSPWRNAWAFSMEILGCPSDKIPLLAFLMLSRGKQSNMPGIRLAAGVARKSAKLQSGRLRGSYQVFSFGVGSLSLSYPLGDHKAVVLFDSGLGGCS